MQQSKIRSLTIRPAESAKTMNVSVDELRDAIGHISICRSSTFDKVRRMRFSTSRDLSEVFPVAYMTPGKDSKDLLERFHNVVIIIISS